MRRAIVFVMDGLRRDFIDPDKTPSLASLRERATFFAAHRSVTPSVTRVASSSVATGCVPAAHGLEGNTLALLEEGRFVIHDAGRPDFLQHRRRVTGHSLDRPTLSERVKETGGAAIYSNVSPGAAYTHDPDGHGYLFHRVASYGPGRNALPPLPIGSDIDGDRIMTEGFVETILSQKPWLMRWPGCPSPTPRSTQRRSARPSISPRCGPRMRLRVA
jgi:hypothetical protein